VDVNKILSEENPDVKNKFRDILKEVGFVEINPSFDRTLKCFTVMKVIPLDSDIPVKYAELVSQQKLKGSVKRFEPGSKICVFKLYT